MKKNINVMMGGPSAEHEVSLQSGLAVLVAIDKTAYAVKGVVIGRRKEFYSCTADAHHLPTIGDLTDPQTASCFQGPFTPASSAVLWDKCDAAFLALHGSFGEDGVLQGYLDSIGIPYTGSGVYASAVAMNKIASKHLFLQNGLAVPPWSIYGRRFPLNTIEHIALQHGFPCFVKCPQSGSSKLMGCASTLSELASLLDEFCRYSPEILIETAIQGSEFTCGVLEDADGQPFALPPVEIRPKARFFDYTAKYTTGASEEIVPAPQPKELIERIRETALAAHQILGCSGISRTDMIYRQDTLFVLETNTLPGLTANSLIPKSYQANGGTFSELIDLLLRHALTRKNQARQ